MCPLDSYPFEGDANHGPFRLIFDLQASCNRLFEIPSVLCLFTIQLLWGSNDVMGHLFSSMPLVKLFSVEDLVPY